jgi:hypothetical protein
MDIGGYFYFDGTTKSIGLWSPYQLRLIADLLEEFNKPHDKKVRKHFKNEISKIPNNLDFK